MAQPTLTNNTPDFDFAINALMKASVIQVVLAVHLPLYVGTGQAVLNCHEVIYKPNYEL